MAASYLQTRRPFRDRGGVRTLTSRDIGIRDDGDSSSRTREIIQGIFDEFEPKGGCRILLDRRDDGFYGLDSLLALKSDCHVEGWGAGCWLKNTSVLTDRTSHVFAAGTYHPAYWDDLTYYTGNAISAPTNVFDCATAAQAGNFAVGELVVVRSLQFYKGAGAHTRPHFILCAQVLSANASNGEITLDTVIDEALTDPQIGHLNGTGITPSATPYPTLYAPKNCSLRNLSIESASGNPCELGGGIGIELDVHEWVGDTGVYVNTIARSYWHIRRMRVTEKAVDLAAECHGLRARVDHLDYVGPADPGISLVLASENTRDCEVRFGTMNLGLRAAGDPIKLQHCRRVTVGWNRMVALSEIGSIVVFNSSTISPAAGSETNLTQPYCHDNVVDPGETICPASGFDRFISFGNTGGELKRPVVKAGKFFGTPGTAACNLDGDDGLIEDGCSFEAGNLVANSGATNWRARGVKAVGLVDNSSAANSYLSLHSGALEQFVDIPGPAFDVCEGSAALATFGNTRWRGWALDASTDESIASSVRVPAGYTKVSASVDWINNSSGSGDVRLDFAVGAFISGETTAATTQTASATATAGSQHFMVTTELGASGIIVAPGDTLFIRVRRDADNVADTLANDIVIGHVELRFFN